MAFDRDAVYLGTQSGAVYVHRRDEGDWVQVATDLPEILSVEVAAV
jgi:hypothetical protein